MSDCESYLESTIKVVDSGLITVVRVGCCAHWEDKEQWGNKRLRCVWIRGTWQLTQPPAVIWPIKSQCDGDQ